VGLFWIQTGDTAVLVTATRSAGREGIDFQFTNCGLRRKTLRRGSIPGRFLYGRRSQKTILTSCLIDRPCIRPLFPNEGMTRKIIATTLSLDEATPDV